MNTRQASFGGFLVLIGALAATDAYGQCSRGGGGGQRGGGTSTGQSVPSQMATSLPYGMNSGMTNQYANFSNYANVAYQQMQQAMVQQQLQRAYLQQMMQQEALARAAQAAERREATRQKRLATANARRSREAKRMDEEFRRSQSSLASTK